MTKEEFLELYKDIEVFINASDRLTHNEALNSDFVWNYFELGWKIVEKSLLQVLPQEALEEINWWFFEKPYLKKGVHMKDAEGNPIPTETPEDLWNIINPEITLKDIVEEIPNL